jgi:3-deoxy-D-arabino-heptulosonate 7-phosphate (DAHP) synthase class II
MEAYNREVKKIQKKMAEAGDMMVAALHERFMDFFKRCTEKMTKEKKRFKCTAFENFELFLEDLPKLATCTQNFALRQQMADLAEKTKKLVQGVDLEELKESSEYRQALGREFKKVEKDAAELMEAIPSRSIKVMKKKAA